MNGNPMLTTGLIILLATVGLSWVVSMRARRLLDSSQKVALSDALSAYQTWRIIFIACLFLGYPLVRKQFPNSTGLTFVIQCSVFVVYLGVVDIVISKKLRALGIPESYVRKYRLSRALAYCGLAIFLFLSVAGLMMPR